MSDLIRSAVNSIGPLDRKAMAAAKERQFNLTKPRGSLGRLEELSVQIAGITGNPLPGVARKAIVTMAGDHGVVEEGVSLYPQAVTREMVFNFLRGGAAINVMARLIGARVVIVDMGVCGGFESGPDMRAGFTPPDTALREIPRPAHGLGMTSKLVCKMVDFGTMNMARGPAMTREQAAASVEAGITVVQKEAEAGLDIVGTGDMGIGNTTPSAAICAVFSGKPVAKIAGRGTGLDDKGVAHKVEVIERALALNRPDPNDAMDVLAKVGGFEIGGLAGVMLGAAARRIPVVVDGFISGAAAMVACGLCPALKGYLIQSHASAEAGHKIMLRQLRLKALLDLNMRLGEGTGAALGIFLAEAAVKTLAEMATFGEAGVSDKE